MPMHFKNWYRSLPSNRILEFRDKIISECGITKPVFYNWLNDITPVPRLARNAIIEIAGCDILFESVPAEQVPSEHPQD